MSKCGCTCACHATEGSPEWPGPCDGCCEPGDDCVDGRVLAEYQRRHLQPRQVNADALGEALFRAGIGPGRGRDAPDILPWAKEHQQEWARWIGQAEAHIIAEAVRLTSTRRYEAEAADAERTPTDEGPQGPR